MISLPDEAAMTAALKLNLDANLRRLLADRINDSQATDLIDLTHIVIIQSSDCDEDLVEEIGRGLLTNPFDGARYYSRSFQPHWNWLEDHGGWYEFILPDGNDGFAFIILVENTPTADPRLIELCRAYAADHNLGTGA